MSLRSQAAAELRANLNADGDAMTLIAPDGTEYPVTGSILRTDETTEPGTRARVDESRIGVRVAWEDIPMDFAELWTFKGSDIDGAVEGIVRSPKFDRTLGFVNFVVERYEVESE